MGLYKCEPRTHGLSAFTVPLHLKPQPLLLNQEDYDDASTRNKFHKSLKKQNALSISPDVIQYLIVPHDEDENNILELYNYIIRLYTLRYSRKYAVLVTTAIMTVDRIQQNI